MWVKIYLQDIFHYADNQIKEMKMRGKKMESLQQKARFYERKTKLVSSLYQKSNEHLAKHKQKQARTKKIAVPVLLKSSQMIDLATELQFQC